MERGQKANCSSKVRIMQTLDFTGTRIFLKFKDVKTMFGINVRYYWQESNSSLLGLPHKKNLQNASYGNWDFLKPVIYSRYSSIVIRVNYCVLLPIPRVVLLPRLLPFR